MSKVDIKILKKQVLALSYLNDSVTKEVLYGGGAGGGKSFLGCLWIITMCVNYPSSRYLIGRAKLSTLKITTLKTFFEVVSLLGIGSEINYNKIEKLITFSNGSEIVLKDLFLYPSDPDFDELGSLEITGYFIDECNQVTEKAKKIVSSRCRYKLTEYNLIPKGFLSCNPAKNWVFKSFYLPSKNGELEEKKKFIQALATDNRHLPPSYLDSLRDLDDASRERLLYGNWEYDDDKAKLFDYDALNNIFTNTHVSKGVKYLTVDVARKGKDLTVIVLWDGLRVTDIITEEKTNISLLAERIKGISDKYSIPMRNIIADEDGVGGGLVDVLNCTGFVNNSRPLKENNKVPNYNNIKSQCYFTLAKKVANSEIFSEVRTLKESIIDELSSVKVKGIEKEGKIMINSKEEQKNIIGHSPDYADAIMMRMYFELKSSKSWLDEFI